MSMKKLLPLFLLLLCVSYGHAQTKTANGLTYAYDRFKDRTEVSFDGYGIGILETAGFVHSGAVLTKTQDEYYLMFVGTRNSCSGFCFKGGTSLIMLIDGERVAVGDDDRLDDGVYFVVDRDLIARIAGAARVEYQVGRFEGKWTQKTIDKFKALLAAGTVK